MREGRRKRRPKDENWEVRKGEAKKKKEEENSLASIRGKRRPLRCRPMKMDGGFAPERDGEMP